MKSNALIIPIIILIILLFSVIGITTYCIGSRFTWNLTLSSTLSAFMGAFFAFLFVRLGEISEKIYQRQIRNYNALVSIEHNLNQCLNEISSNLFVSAQIRKISEKLEKPNVVPITFNKLQPFGIEFEIIQLTNLDFINDMAEFLSDIKKMNCSINGMNVFYDEIKDALIQKYFSRKEYSNNFLIYVQKLEEFEKFLVNSETKAKRLLVITRMLLNKKPLLSRFINYFSQTFYDKSLQQNISKELEKLESEIKVVRKKSAEEISKVIANRGDK